MKTASLYRFEVSALRTLVTDSYFAAIKLSVQNPVENSLTEVARLFLRLGFTAFGGPAAHIAMMENEVVRKRKWMTPGHFLDLIGATNLIPGPNSTEMTMHCGHERAGWKGLIVAGLCFILPAVIITASLAWAYEEYGQLPEVSRFIYGIKPAIIAVIVSTMFSLGRKALKSTTLGVMGFLALVLALAGVNEIIVLFGFGAIGIIIHHWQRGRAHSVSPLLLLSAIGTNIPALAIFWKFLKIGCILYGSGYVLFAFVDTEFVSTGIITKQQLIDAIAVGQFTPGPVFSAATFIGWQVGGFWGAIAATIGIFLPSFVFVAFLNPLIPMLRKSNAMAAFLDTVNIVSIAVILAVVYEMGKETLMDWRTITIALLSGIVTFYFKSLNTAWVVIGGALIGYLFSML